MLENLALFAWFLGTFFTAGPTVQLNDAIITGIDAANVSKFLGIPYALPPVGSLRFRKPVPFEITSDRNVQSYGPSCPQQKVGFVPFNGSADISAFGNNPVLNYAPGEESEDCLTINVMRPLDTGPQDRYPVVVWIYGGAFQFGNAESHDIMGARIVKRSVALGTPVIYVAMNYRSSAFGFLGGQQVFEEKVGNLGLWDQRLALSWVKRHIESFGGNSSQIMIWGISSGAISVALQMIGPDSGENKEDLFHSAFMQSGATIPIGHITEGQKHYDFLLKETGCAKPGIDTLNCLRILDYPILKAAVDKSPSVSDYTSLNLAWVPRADGEFLKDNPQRMTQRGLVAKVPFVSGGVDDEGTVFGLSSRSVTTEEDFRQYVHEIFAPKAPIEELDPLWTLYPSIPSEGSPFDTGNNNTFLSPQFKRMSAFQGDVVFQAPIRFFLQSLSGRQKMWSFLSKQLKYLPALGSFHGSDFLLTLMEDYLIRFAVRHDPNNGTEPVWPEYTRESPQRYIFPPWFGTPTVQLDTQRADQMAFLTNLSLAYPL
ncbi:hypothetical protein M413DRAFT_155653 [Hebeloma cylindrosporum]|uniref:Carboxylic ester hydrolase n=1 Tax=Hebeloma cylindrosporum TaxID=76867 RepID=A0A0C3CBB9_HEBCY|nr:hypothetical protein M413DRAFT_155653 [Hebeloma cylindrosporum h7]